MATLKKCEYCNKEFTGRSNKRFCSNSCRTLNSKKKKIETNTINSIPTTQEQKEVITTKINNLKSTIQKHKIEIQNIENQKQAYIKKEENKITQLQRQKQQLTTELHESENKKTDGFSIGVKVLGALISEDFRRDMTLEYQRKKALPTMIKDIDNKLKNKISFNGVGLLPYEFKINDIKSEIKGLQSQIDILKDERNKIVVEELKHKKRLTPKDLKLMAKYSPNYGFKGVWRTFIGTPTVPFHILIHGSAGSGKSHFCVQLAKYLVDDFGLLIYVNAEEGKSNTFIEKLIRYNVSSDNFISLDEDNKAEIEQEIKELSPKFIIIDSLTTCKISNNDIEIYKRKFPKTSFITISQSTTQGKARGGTEFEHNCQMVIKIVDGKAISIKNRFSGWSNKEFFIFPK